ncbi:MAG: IS30 family transposase, partial [Betaproteobacteria bacterium]
MQTSTTYRQLQPEERMTIASLRQARSSVRAIARALGRSPGTISRELARNVGSDGSYASLPAQALSRSRRIQARPAAKLHQDHVLWGTVLTMLDWKWSPQQIAGVLKRVWPDDPTMQVSHESIYTAIYAHPRGELRRQLIACLRHGRSTRMPRKRGVDRRGTIPDMVSIHVRPPEIEDRDPAPEKRSFWLMMESDIG